MPDVDVLIVGAGPAGAVAATILARAGARVRLLDRAIFPRDKLCGDTINPGTVAILKRLQLAASLDRCSLPIAGMRLSGHNAALSLVALHRAIPGVAHEDRDGVLRVEVD